MWPALIAFIVSGLGVVGMVTVRAYELRAGRKLFSFQWRTSIDYAIHRKVSFVRQTIGDAKNVTFSYVVKHSMLSLALLFFRTGRKMQTMAMQFLDWAKQSNTLKNKGSASFFLKQVSEHKQTLRESE